MSTKSDTSMSFGPFRIAQEHVFYESSLTAAFVNLRPLVPGHVLVVPKRVVPHLKDLTSEEHAALWESVRVVQDVMGRHYTEAEAFNVAVQDGKAAGQSVPHVHVHILPRVPGDYERNDQIYDDIQDWAPRDEFKQKVKLEVAEDEDRKPRTVEQMSEEAAKYRNLIP